MVVPKKVIHVSRIFHSKLSIFGDPLFLETHQIPLTPFPHDFPMIFPMVKQPCKALEHHHTGITGNDQLDPL